MVWATFRKSSRVNAYIIGFAIADAFANTLKLDLKRFDWSIQGAKKYLLGLKKLKSTKYYLISISSLNCHVQGKITKMINKGKFSGFYEFTPYMIFSIFLKMAIPMV